MNGINHEVIQIACVYVMDGQGFMPFIRSKVNKLGTSYSYENPLFSKFDPKVVLQFHI